MHLLALTHQNTIVPNSIRHPVESHNPAQHLLGVYPHGNGDAVAPERKTDDVVAQDDHEDVLDTPAPRKRPPVPTLYEPAAAAAYQSNGSSQCEKQSSTESGVCSLMVLFCLQQNVCYLYVYMCM